MGDTFNSNDNITIAHGISLWFQRDWAGAFVELGDCVVDGVDLAPEFYEFRSYRNGRNSLRKKLLVDASASINVTLNEIHAVNLQRVVYGSAVTAGASCTMRDARQLTVHCETNGLYVDLVTDASEPVATVTSCTVTGIYPDTDVLHTMGASIQNTTPTAAGLVFFSHTDLEEGDTVYVTYTIAKSGMFSTEIFGASDSTIEGAAQLNIRNMNGGVVQCWDLASVALAPNGSISLPVDSHQTLPMVLTLAERGGTWGTIYVS